MTSEDEILYDEDICANTRKPIMECSCYDCQPEIFRFKFLCIGCDDIDDVISTLEGTMSYFKKLKNEGYTIGGGIMDDYMYLLPPEKLGFYPIRDVDGNI